MTALYVTLGLVILLAAALVIAYVIYSATPQAAWKKRVLAKAAEWQRLIDNADAGAATQAKAEATLKELRLAQHLDTIPLDRLADYPNIGPGIVDSVRSAGFTKTSQMWTLKWWASAPGIGEKRAQWLTEAANAIRDDATTKFNAGISPEGKAFQQELLAFREKERIAANERQRTKLAAQDAMRQAQPIINTAQAATFLHFITGQLAKAVSPEMMNRALPDLVIPPAPPEVVAPAPVPATSTAPSVPPTPVPSVTSSPIDEKQLDRMRAYCRFAFVIARADGRVAVGEKKEIRAFLAEMFGQDARLLRHLDPVIEQCENPPPVEEDAVLAVKAITTPSQRNELMTVARRITDAVGDRSQKEQKVLDRIADALGVGHVAAVPSSMPEGTIDESAARKTLEIDAKTELTAELVRRRFNILTDQYDPKRAAGLGAEFAKMAERKREDVKAAAESLLVALGEPLVPPPKETPAAAAGDLRHNPDLDAVFGM
jgi:uncharacterized tellurite resistance protein B-like protein